jgi:hypothetical protein
MNVAKLISEFAFNHDTKTPEDIKRIESYQPAGSEPLPPSFYSQLGISGVSSLEFLEICIEHSMYLLSCFPSYSLLSPFMELDAKLHFLGLLTEKVLERFASRKEDVENSLNRDAEYYYYNYERLLLSAKATDKEIDQARFLALRAELEHSKTTLFQMHQLLSAPFNPMPQDKQGFQLSGPLNYPSSPQESDVVVCSEFIGYKIDANRNIELLVKEWRPGDDPKNKLFTTDELLQLVRSGVTDAFFSLDQVNPNHLVEPVQQVRYSPHNMPDILVACLQTTDLILKMLAKGKRLRMIPPYDHDDIDELLDGLDHTIINKLLFLSRNTYLRQSNATRFWIELGKTPFHQKNENGVTTVTFYEPEVTIKKHAMEQNLQGDLVDMFQEFLDTSPEAKYAGAFTDYYDEISDHLPIFKQLLEFTKIGGAVKHLQELREASKHLPDTPFQTLGLGPVTKLDGKSNTDRRTPSITVKKNFTLSTGGVKRSIELKSLTQAEVSKLESANRLLGQSSSFSSLLDIDIARAAIRNADWKASNSLDFMLSKQSLERQIQATELRLSEERSRFQFQQSVFAQHSLKKETFNFLTNEVDKPNHSLTSWRVAQEIPQAAKAGPSILAQQAVSQMRTPAAVITPQESRNSVHSNATPPALPSKATRLSASDLAQSALTGALEGIGDIWESFKHPIDNLLLPSKDFVIDSLIIAMAHLPKAVSSTPFDTPDVVNFNELYNKVASDQNLYNQALLNMEKRGQNLQTLAKDLKSSPADEQTRLASRTLVNFLNPIDYLKIGKVLGKTLSQVPLSQTPSMTFKQKAMSETSLSSGNSGMDFVLESHLEGPPGSLGAKGVHSINSRVHQAGLPDTGIVRFIPPAHYTSEFAKHSPLPKGPHGGYIDRVGNEWVKGPSRTLGENFEWDIRLSTKGYAQCKWHDKVKNGSNGPFINVSQGGRISHSERHDQDDKFDPPTAGMPKAIAILATSLAITTCSANAITESGANALIDAINQQRPAQNYSQHLLTTPLGDNRPKVYRDQIKNLFTPALYERLKEHKIPRPRETVQYHHEKLLNLQLHDIKPYSRAGSTDPLAPSIFMITGEASITHPSLKKGSGIAGKVKLHMTASGKEIAVKSSLIKSQTFPPMLSSDLAHEMYNNEVAALRAMGRLMGHGIKIKSENEVKAYVAMPFYEAQPLGSHAKKWTYLNEKQVVRLMIDIVHEVQELHKNRIAHNDIHANNVLINIDNPGKEFAKLIDFGCAVKFGTPTDQTPKHKLNLLPPDSRPVNEKSDIEGLRQTFTVLGRMINGAKPEFVGKLNWLLMKLHAQDLTINEIESELNNIDSMLNKADVKNGYSPL